MNLFNPAFMPRKTSTVTRATAVKSEQQNPETVVIDSTQLRLSQAGPARVLRYPLADRAADAPQILAYLKQFVDAYGREPFIREFTRSILPAHTRDNDLGVIVRTVSSWVRDNITYLADPSGAEYFISPVNLIEQWQRYGKAYGDCDDHVLLMNSMLNSAGIPTRVVGVHLNDRVLWDHVIGSVFVDGRWVDIDPCLKTNEARDYREKLIS